jgi:hypothetical protein
VVLVFICLWVILFSKNVFLITILHFPVIPDGQFFYVFQWKKSLCVKQHFIKCSIIIRISAFSFQSNVWIAVVE